ncbi:hypothetical protein J6590_037277 [Homalodisca vitripennis]|nr:hypothetical protein J6590_037277 [Homalodisca vitripennis]
MQKRRYSHLPCYNVLVFDQPKQLLLLFLAISRFEEQQVAPPFTSCPCSDSNWPRESDHWAVCTRNEKIRKFITITPEWASGVWWMRLSPSFVDSGRGPSRNAAVSVPLPCHCRCRAHGRDRPLILIKHSKEIHRERNKRSDDLILVVLTIISLLIA